MHFSISHIKNAPKVPFNLDGRILHSSDELEIVHLTLAPREELGMHSQPIEVMFYVIEGDGILTIEQQRVEAYPGMMIGVSAGSMRSWFNDGQEELKLLVIKKFS